jgi:hypothetical protein
MPLKTLISIPVDDDRFKEFLALFAKYEAALKAMPGAWHDVGDAAAKSGVGFEGLAAAAMAQVDILHKLNQEERQRERTVTGTASSMRRMAHDARDVAKHITESTRQLMRWSGVTGMLGGLAGLGGLYGFDNMIRGASSTRTRSLSLGVRPGTLLALQSNLGQLINPESAMQRIVGMQQNPNAATKFLTMGLSNDVSAPPDKALLDIMGVANRFYQQTKAQGGLEFLSVQPQWQAIVSALGEEGARTVGNLRPGELASLTARTRRDQVTNFGQAPGTFRAAQDLQQQLTRVSSILEYKFLGALSPLMPELTKLSGAIGGTIADLIGSNGFKHAVSFATDELNDFDNFMKNPKTKKNIDDFVNAIGTAAGDIKGAFTWLNKGPWFDSKGKYKDDNFWGKKGWESLANQFDKAMGWPLTYPDVGTGGAPGTPGGGGSGAGGTSSSSKAPLFNWWHAHAPAWLGGTGAGSPTGPVSTGPGNWEVQHNNFAGMRRTDVPAAGPNQGGFQSFPTPAAGVAAIEHQLDRYYQGKTTHSPLTTLRSMISEWAPPNENDTAALIARAVRVVGVGADRALNWSDPATRAKVIEAFIRNEQGGQLPAAAATALYGALPKKGTARPGAAVPPVPPGFLTALATNGDEYRLTMEQYSNFIKGAPGHGDAWLHAHPSLLIHHAIKEELKRVSPRHSAPPAHSPVVGSTTMTLSRTVKPGTPTKVDIHVHNEAGSSIGISTAMLAVP